MDVNEEIVVKWLNLCKRQFTIENITFVVPYNYSDIDILATDKYGNYYDYEVKWRSAASVGATNKEKISALINQMTRKERQEKIREIIGDKKYKRIFITTKQFFGSEKKREVIETEFAKNNIEVIYFEEIIKELVGKIKIKGRYDSPILQTIRMLKYFDLVKEKGN